MASSGSGGQDVRAWLEDAWRRGESALDDDRMTPRRRQSGASIDCDTLCDGYAVVGLASPH